VKFCENQRKMQDIYKEHLPLTGKNYLTVISSKYTYVYLKTFDQNMSVGAYLHILKHSLGFPSKSFVYFSLETQLFQFVQSSAHKLFYCSFLTLKLYEFENLFCRETQNFSYQIKKENSFLLICSKETYTFDNYLVKLEEYFVC
jgi:hypothetical protein